MSVWSDAYQFPQVHHKQLLLKTFLANIPPTLQLFPIHTCVYSSHVLHSMANFINLFPSKHFGAHWNHLYHCIKKTTWMCWLNMDEQKNQFTMPAFRTCYSQSLTVRSLHRACQPAGMTPFIGSSKVHSSCIQTEHLYLHSNNKYSCHGYGQSLTKSKIFFNATV